MFVRVGSLTHTTVQLDTKLLRFRTPTGEPPHIWRQKHFLFSLGNLADSKLSATLVIVIVLACAAFVISAVVLAGLAVCRRKIIVYV